MKFFQFCLFVLIATLGHFSFANCQFFLLPESTPSADEQTLIAQIVTEMNMLPFLSVEAESVSLLSAETPDIRWYAEVSLLSSTQLVLKPSRPAPLTRVLAEQAFEKTKEAFKDYQLILHMDLIQPVGRPRVRVGYVQAEPPVEESEATLAVFGISTADDAATEKTTLDLLRINLVFYKNLRDLLYTPKAQE